MNLEGTIYVDCPCCGARLEARRDDGRVINHWKKRPKTEGDPIKAAIEREKKEKDRFKDLLSNANKIIEDDKKRIMEKFEREKKRLEEEGDDGLPPPSPFGFD